MLQILGFTWQVVRRNNWLVCKEKQKGHKNLRPDLVVSYTILQLLRKSDLSVMVPFKPSSCSEGIVILRESCKGRWPQREESVSEEAELCLGL